jgi:DNA-binding CsgD family transcriptional regulator
MRECRSMAAEVIGREQELEELGRFLGAVDGLPAALVLEGSPGIGKTVLWRAGLDLARARGFRVIAAIPAPAETRLSLSGMVDLLAPVLADVLPALPAPQRRALEIALLLAEPEGSLPDARALDAALLSALRVLAGDRLLVAVDDVQWLDGASAAALSFAVRRLHDEPIALLLTRRLEEGRSPGALDLDRAFSPVRIERVSVGPLSVGALHKVIQSGLEVSLPRPLMRRVHETSGGNPFFALELGRAVMRRGGEIDPGAALPLPEELLSLVSERLAALPDETGSALTAVAAVSQPTTRLINAVVDEGMAALEAAVDANVIVVVGDRVAFTHPLFATAAYLMAPPSRRRELHQRLASFVGEPEERARHLALVAEAPDEDVAQALERGARQAFERGAPSAAADLSALARRLTPADAAGGARRRSLAEAEYALQAGDPERVREVLEDVLAVSPPGSARAEALSYLGRYYMSGIDWRKSAEVLWDALGEAGADPLVRAHCELELAVTLLLIRADMHDVASHARAAAVLAEQVGELEVLGEALAIQAESEFLLGRPPAPAVRDRALELEQSMDDIFPVVRPSSFFAYVDALSDHRVRALAAYDQLCARANEHGDESSLAWLLLRAALVEVSTGAWQQAEQRIAEAEEIVVQTGQSANHALALATRALLEAHLGNVLAARKAGGAALELADRTGAAIPRWIAVTALGFLELSLDRWAEAETTLTPLVAQTRAASIGEPGELRFLPDLIETLIALGRTEDGARHLEFLEERAGATRRLSALAAAARCRALIALSRGDVAGSLADAERALDLQDRLEMKFERARTRLVLGVARRRALQMRDARTALSEALAAFDELDARLWSEKARRELARIGGRTAAGSRLTATEERVAALVAEGLTNKQVAGRLFVTDRTVEGHLSRIYAKLGLRSRAELAARFAVKT